MRVEPRSFMRLGGAVPIVAVTLALAACGGSGSASATVSVPTVAPARVYALAGFQPAAPVAPGRQTLLSFSITQPSGRTLTAYRTCCDPHEGIDLIIVRSDDSHVQYDDSDIAPNGSVSQPVVFPAPGRYRIVIDAYPKHTQPDSPINFQLFTWVTVKGAYHPQLVPSFNPTLTVDGYRFTIERHPSLAAIQASFLDVNVTGPDGRPAVFGSWRGALAHAIFIEQGSLNYFHTHVCAPGAIYCTSVLGAIKVTGSSSTPGHLRVGVLLPVPGVWRLFLLTHIGGKYLTAPFTLDVH